MTKAIFTLSSVFIGLEFWSVNHTSMHENFELKVFNNVKFLAEISSNSSKDLLETNVYKTQEFVDNHCQQY